MQEIRAMSLYHFSSTGLWWPNGGGHWGLGLCTFTCRAFGLGVVERTPLSFHGEGRVGLGALCCHCIDKVRGRSFGVLYREASGDGPPNAGAGVTAETKSVSVMRGG